MLRALCSLFDLKEVPLVAIDFLPGLLEVRLVLELDVLQHGPRRTVRFLAVIVTAAVHPFYLVAGQTVPLLLVGDLLAHDIHELAFLLDKHPSTSQPSSFSHSCRLLSTNLSILVEISRFDSIVTLNCS